VVYFSITDTKSCNTLYCEDSPGKYCCDSPSNIYLLRMTFDFTEYSF